MWKFPLKTFKWKLLKCQKSNGSCGYAWPNPHYRRPGFPKNAQIWSSTDVLIPEFKLARPRNKVWTWMILIVFGFMWGHGHVQDIQNNYRRLRILILNHMWSIQAALHRHGPYICKMAHMQKNSNREKYESRERCSKKLGCPYDNVINLISIRAPRASSSPSCSWSLISPSFRTTRGLFRPGQTCFTC